MLNVMLGDTNPMGGWLVGNVLIHPPEAYIGIENWLSHFEHSLPDKAKKMRDYSQKKGWGTAAHIAHWPTPCLSWLRKNATPNASVCGLPHGKEDK